MPAAISWEQEYACALGLPAPAKKVSTSIGWSLIFLFALQCFLLGVSDEVDDAGKLLFAAVLGFLVIWTLPRVVSHGLPYPERVMKWTLALMLLVACSRLVGISSGIPAVDWLRDSLPLLNFWWILLGPWAFSTRRGVWRAYVVLMVLLAFLALVVTDHYLTIRRFTTGGLELTGYVRASDSVVLFGAFLTLPMVELRRGAHRVCFGLFGASFVAAALMTGTRSHLGAMIAGLAFYFWLTRRTRAKLAPRATRMIVLCVLLGITAVGVALAEGILDAQVVMDRAGEISTLDFGAFTQRVDESVEAWNGFQKSPLLGQGLGYRMPVGLWSIQESQDELFMIHNFYLYILLKFGMVGVPVFFGLFVSVIRTAMSTYRHSRAPFVRAFSAGTASLMVALLVESVTAARFSDRSATALLALVMVFLLSLRRQIAASESVRPSSWPVASSRLTAGPATASQGLR